MRRMLLCKIKGKKVKKFTENESTEPGEQIFVDTSGPFNPSLIGSRYWVKVVNDYSRYSWSEFTRKKDELTEVVIQK